MKRSVFGFALASMLMATSTPAAAQHPQTREGFWFNIGLGYGSPGCDGCGSRLGGFSGGLSLGGVPPGE